MKSTNQHLRNLVLFLLLSPSIWAQNGLHFDGVDDKVNCGNDASIQLTGNSITLEAWIKADFWETQVWAGNIINKEQNAGTSGGYMLRVGEGGKLNMNLGDGNWNELTTQNNVLTLNTWHHIAGTYDGTKMRLYVDGMAVDSTNYSINFINSSANLTIGSHPVWDRFFEGVIDEVRIWNVARTGAEIQQNMQTLQCLNEPGLMAYYRFDQGTAGGNNSGATALVDGLGNSNGTLQTFALSGSTSNWVSSSTPFTPQYQSYSSSDTICSGEFLLFGSQTLTSAGTYQDTLPSTFSCDSIIQLNLTVKSINDSAYISGDTLWAYDPSLTYHWIDCNNQNRTIPGATDQFYVPFISTSYAVIVSDGDCVDTSDCFSFNIGLEENLLTQIKTYPNPVQQDLFLDIQNLGKLASFSLMNAEGKIVLEPTKANSKKTRIDMSAFPSGMYQLILLDENQQRFSKKVLKL
jgi:hypothetical protein